MDANGTDLNDDRTSNDNMSDAPFTGRRVILAVTEHEEQQAFGEMLVDMDIDVLIASSAGEALQLLEDHPSDLLIMDVNQPDMHGWPMINKIREINELRDLPITVITDQPNMGITVARVNYLNRPVSIARLRQSVIKALDGSV